MNVRIILAFTPFSRNRINEKLAEDSVSPSCVVGVALLLGWLACRVPPHLCCGIRFKQLLIDSRQLMSSDCALLTLHSVHQKIDAEKLDLKPERTSTCQFQSVKQGETIEQTI